MSHVTILEANLAVCPFFTARHCTGHRAVRLSPDPETITYCEDIGLDVQS